MVLRKQIVMILLITLVAIIGAGLITFLAHLLQTDMGSMFFHILVHIAYLLFCLWVFWSIGAGYKANMTDRANQVDLPDYLDKPRAELESLGFSYMALAQTFERLNPLNYELLYTNDDHSILATIGMIDVEAETYRIELISAFPDEALLATTYPTGTLTDTPHLKRVGIKNSLSHAYHFHLRQMGSFIQQFGDPLVINSYDRVQGIIDRSMSKQLQYVLSRDFVMALILLSLIDAVILSGLTLTIGWNFLTDAHRGLLAIAIVMMGMVVYRMFKLDGKDIRQIKKKEAKS